MGLEVKRQAGALGAEIGGVDLAGELGNAAFDAILEAFHEHAVLVFRGQDLSPEAQVAFSRRFGPAIAHVLEGFRLTDNPEVFLISNEVEDGKPKGAIYAGQYWHSDLSYSDRPALGSMLHAREVPGAGGDTMFASMEAAYRALSPTMREILSGLSAVHDYAHAYETVFSKLPNRPPMTEKERARVPPVTHPIVRTHPETGRRSLFINPGFTRHIVGLLEEESAALLDFLFGHATRPEFIYRHQWQAGDVVLWDNRSTMHRAVADYDMTEVRHMHRTTIGESRPVR